MSLSVVHDNIFTLPVKTIALLDRSALLASRARALASAGLCGVDMGLQRELEEMKTCIHQFHSTLAPIGDMTGIYRDISIAAAAVPPDMAEDAITNGLRNNALFSPLSESDDTVSSSSAVARSSPKPDSEPPQRINAVMVCSQTAVQGALMELYNVPAQYAGPGETDRSTKAKMLAAARYIADIAKATGGLEAASLGVSVGVRVLSRISALSL